MFSVKLKAGLIGIFATFVGCATVEDIGLASATKDLTTVQRIIIPNLYDDSKQMMSDGLNTAGQMLDERSTANPAADLSESDFQSMNDEILCNWSGYEKAENEITRRGIHCPDEFPAKFARNDLERSFRCLRAATLYKQNGGVVTMYEFRRLSSSVPMNPRAAYIKYSKMADKFVENIAVESGDESLAAFVEECIRGSASPVG